MKSINDVQLIKRRQVNFHQSVRTNIESRCEEKISKYKLEESHSSLPSSLKSTFIMTFSPDGQRVASTHGDHRIYICDLNTGKLLDTLEGHPKTPWCLAWHPTNRGILASGCLAGEVRVWDLKSKACESWTSENNSIITSLDFHPKERVLVIATANEVLFWDWSESEPFAKTTTLHEREKVKFVVFDSTGTKLITGIANLPKYSGYNTDSLQSRIIDGYLSPRTIEISAENMTQNSEIATNASNNHSTINSSHGNPSDELVRRLEVGENPLSMIGGLISNSNNDINCWNTMLLSRVAMLYRQLEALEDSMRHTSFSPIVGSRPVVQPIETSQYTNIATDSSESRNTNDAASSEDPENRQAQTDSTQPTTSSETTESTTRIIQSEHMNDGQAQIREQTQNNLTPPASNTFDSYLVTFDESLEQLQLPPLVLGGQIVNLTNVIEQYPIDIPNQMNYAMQFESINQVNQNFIRISKLMSSARLYRQIVQQILSSSSPATPNPNQILTVQSASLRSPRNSPNMPIVLRNVQMGTYFGSAGLSRAIQYRDLPRNVPIATICKIDLLAARAFFIKHSQALVEQSSANNRTISLERTAQSRATSANPSTTGAQAEEPRLSDLWTDNNSVTYHQILDQLHSVLTKINHAPLTTSNAYTHISSLRVSIERLLRALETSLDSSTESCRLIDLIHKIAFNLTGRNWRMPLGATLDEIRLDVIHILCIVDLALHLARQVQLLQLQRISLLARIEESRRPTHRVAIADNLAQQQPRSSSREETTNVDTANSGETRDVPSTSYSTDKKRKDSEYISNTKRRRVNSVNSQIESVNNASVADQNGTPIMSVDQIGQNRAAAPESQMIATPSNLTTPERLLSWSYPQANLEQSLNRFLVASAPSIANSHIWVRIYHRMHGVNPPSIPVATGMLDQPIERAVNTNDFREIYHEDRRRALSQDNSFEMHDANIQPRAQVSSSNNASGHHHNSGHHRTRVRPPTAYQVNIVPGQNQTHIHAHHHGASGIVLDPLQRPQHVHVIQARAPGQHLWLNQWTLPFPFNPNNYRLQCWNFSLSTIPSIRDCRCNLITTKCRIHNDSSVDISSDGNLIACLVPREDHPCPVSFDLKIFSLKTEDFGACYYKLPHGHNAISVSFSPSGNFAVVGLTGNKLIHGNTEEDDLTIAKIYKLSLRGSFEFMRDVKIKRDDSNQSLNTIQWLSRGLVYNVGPQHHQRYRMRNMMAP